MALIELSDEKRAILATRPPVVAAGAGSGKTTLLVRALYDDVVRDDVPLEALFVAAFNRAAAAHLVAKVAEEFARGREPFEPVVELDDAWIGTFHDLCARILREQPHAAGVAPDFVVIDEVEALVLIEESITEAIETTEHPSLVDLLVRVDTGVRGAVRSTFDRLRSAGIASPVIPVPDEPIVETETLRDLARQVYDHPATNPRNRDRAATILDAIVTGEFGKAERVHLTCAQIVKPLHEACGAALDAVQKAVAEREARPLLAALAAVFDRFLAIYTERKERQGALDYEDLQLRARDVLADPAAGARYRGRFQRVYIDEAQDTNRLQQDIVALLAATRTMQVGDEHQSIYRFRWADVDAFRSVAGAAPATLLANFRSQRPVLDVLNGWFTDLIGSAFRHLEVAVDANDGAERPVELVIVESTEGAPPPREAEAAELALIARRLHDAEGFAWSEIAVLFRALTEVDPYRRALEAAGIPVLLVAGQGFFKHDQVVDVLALLHVVANPRDDEQLIRALAAPYAAASDRDLVDLREAAGQYVPLWNGIDAIPALAAFAATVRTLRRRVRDLDLPGLVEAAISALDYELAALGLDEPDRRHANLRKLVRLADAHAATGANDLRGFLRFLDDYEELAKDPGESVVIDESQDAIRLLSIHAAKGLEYPAVILADTNHKPGGGYPMLLVTPDGRVGLRMQSEDGGDPQRLFELEALEQAEKAANDAEERRVHYVALTRAMRRLVITGRARFIGDERKCEHALALLTEPLDLPAAGGSADLVVGNGVMHVRSVVVEAVEEPEHLEPMTIKPAVDGPPPAVIDPPTIVPSQRGLQLSYTALELHATCSLRYHLERELGLPSIDETATTPAMPGLGARRFGVAFHALMQEVDWHAPPADGWAATRVGELETLATAADAARAERYCCEARDSTIGHRLREAVEVRTERPFTVQIDGAIVTGFFDVWALEADGTTLIVDWKTGGSGPAGYELQRDLYTRGAFSAGAQVVESAWVGFDPWVMAGRHLLAAPPATTSLGAPVPAALTRQPFCAGCPGLRTFCPVSTTEP